MNKYWVYYRITEHNPRYVLSGPFPTWDAAKQFEENNVPEFENSIIPPMILKHYPVREDEHGVPTEVYPWTTEGEIHSD